jgi:hypothetical protein
MWGSWYGAAAIAGVGALVLIAAAFFAWALIPIAVALFAIAGFSAYQAVKGGREEVASRSDGLATPEDQPEHQPRAAGEGAGGVWGEKREA